MNRPMNGRIEKAIQERNNKVRKILHQIDSTTKKASTGRLELLKHLQTELVVHDHAKERILFPKLEEFGDKETNQLVSRLREEFRIFENLARELDEADPSSILWTSRFEILRDNLEMSMRREENRLSRIADAILNERQKESLLDTLVKEEKDLSTGFA